MATAAARAARKLISRWFSPHNGGTWSAETPCRDEAVERGLEVLTAQHGLHLVAKPTSDPSPRLISLPEVGEFSGKVTWQRSRPLGQPSVGPRRNLWLMGKTARTR